jgi:hypothetical protein
VGRAGNLARGQYAETNTAYSYNISSRRIQRYCYSTVLDINIKVVLVNLKGVYCGRWEDEKYGGRRVSCSLAHCRDAEGIFEFGPPSWRHEGSRQVGTRQSKVERNASNSFGLARFEEVREIPRVDQEFTSRTVYLSMLTMNTK